MMNNGLSAIKNIIWAFAIVVALAALLVGLIFSVASRNYDDAPDGTLVLSSGSQAVDSSSSGLDADPYSSGESSGTLKELPSTQDGGLEYVFGMTYLCTSSFSGISDYISTTGGGSSAIIWADSGSGIPASAAADTEVLLSDGSLVTPSKAAAIYQPKRLVIYIGTDELGTATQESFTAGYKKLISSVQAASSDTTIICCTLASVSSSYSAVDGVTPAKIAEANSWIKQICMDTGVYYADIASLLNGSDGYISDEYVTSDGKTISYAGISAIVEYFRYHCV
jgi:hypothetical protein